MTKLLEKQKLTFKLTDEQELLKNTIRDIAEKNFKEKAREIDKSCRFPKENFELLAKQGMAGLTIPKESGDRGLDYVSYAIVIEEIAKVCASTSVMLLATLLCSDSISKFGSDFLKEKYLKKLAKGEYLGAFVLSEEIKSCLDDEGDHFVLNGTKDWVINGGEADVYVVMAQAEKGVTAFIVEKEIPGVSFGKLDEKLGIHACATCQMRLHNVKVPKENLLGVAGDGYLISMKMLDIEKIGISAQALGIAQASYDLALNYAKTKEVSGQKIIDPQAIQFMLVELATEIEAGRLLTYKAANLCKVGARHGTPLQFTREAAEAKLFCSELATRASHMAIQVLGDYGYTTEYDAERFYRDAMNTEILVGTSEKQHVLIAENIIRELGERIKHLPSNLLSRGQAH